MYHALAICVSKPKNDSGTVLGYAMHQKTPKAIEYIFVEGTIKKRARKGEFASLGEISYEVLASEFGLSLINLHFSKFSMHFPRLFLSHLGSPIFGDNIYMRRLMAVDNLPTPVEPGQVDKGSRYEPLQFLQSVGIRTLAELKPQPPMFLHVYQTLLPFWGDNKTKRRVTELRLQMPPPEHFLAMADLLNFRPAVTRLFDSLDKEDEQLNIASADGTKTNFEKKKRRNQNPTPNVGANLKDDGEEVEEKKRQSVDSNEKEEGKMEVEVKKSNGKKQRREPKPYLGRVGKKTNEITDREQEKKVV